MANYDFSNIEDLKAEEKRLYEEYKQKISELKKVQKEKEHTDKENQVHH